MSPQLEADELDLGDDLLEEEVLQVVKWWLDSFLCACDAFGIMQIISDVVCGCLDIDLCLCWYNLALVRSVCACSMWLLHCPEFGFYLFYCSKSILLSADYVAVIDDRFCKPKCGLYYQLLPISIYMVTINW